MNFINKYQRIIVLLLLIIMFLTEITTARHESQTIDEGVHLAAGYSYLVKNDFRMNQEHPPFLKEMAAVPLLFIKNRLRSPFDKPAWNNYNEWLFAKDLIYDNTVAADTIIFLGRLPFMILSLILGFVIFKWSKELFGTLAGLLSLILYTFSPDFIAHGRYITTDIGVTLFFFLTIYYFYKYLKGSNKWHLWLTALFFALAQVSKFSAIILVIIIPILYCLYCIKSYHIQSGKLLVRKFFQIFAALLISTCIIVFIAYRFEFQVAIDNYDVKNLYSTQEQILSNNTLSERAPLVRQIISLTDVSTKSGQLIRTIATRLPIPAFSYFSGFVKLYVHNYFGHLAYLMGNYSNFGWWYYFPMAFLIKEPLAFLVLLLTISLYFLITFIKNNRYQLLPFKMWQKIPWSGYALVIPPFIYFVWSLTSHLNIGIRHIFIIYPFLFVGVGYLMTLRMSGRKKVLYIGFLIIMVCYYVASSVAIYPNYLAYFNELTGGPGNGPKYLVDSNIDWGQNVKYLKEYMAKNSIDHVCLSYFGQAKLEYYNIDFRYLPDNENFKGTEQLNCVVAISVTSLYSQDGGFKWLLDYQPDKKIGYSIYVYDFRNK
jgi:4-amino-4-deoxy-L-arabinose transferase-like glycosyltransferase